MSSARELLCELGVTHMAIEKLKEREAWLRRKADGMLMEAREAMGADSATVLVCGEKVGKLSVVVSKPSIGVEDADAWQDFLREMYDAGDDRVRVVYEAPAIRSGLAVDRGCVVDPVTGMVARGVRYRPGGEARRTVLTGCKPDDVLAALGRGGRRIESVFRYLDDAGTEVSE